MFQKQNIPLTITDLFSSLFSDYISQSSQVKSFYNGHFSLKDFSKYLKTNEFDYLNRTVLVNALNNQSQLASNTSSLSKANIALLQKGTTYTITTGHQLCLFTGPLYFIYKIASTINLCKSLSNFLTIS